MDVKIYGHINKNNKLLNNTLATTPITADYKTNRVGVGVGWGALFDEREVVF